MAITVSELKLLANRLTARLRCVEAERDAALARVERAEAALQPFGGKAMDGILTDLGSLHVLRADVASKRTRDAEQRWAFEKAVAAARAALARAALAPQDDAT